LTLSFFSPAAKILDLPANQLNLTVFCSATQQIFGICQQKQLKLTGFRSAVQRK
jgi:hypothetical protein